MKSIKTTIEMILKEMQTVLSDLDLQSIEAAIKGAWRMPSEYS